MGVNVILYMVLQKKYKKYSKKFGVYYECITFDAWIYN